MPLQSNKSMGGGAGPQLCTDCKEEVEAEQGAAPRRPALRMSG